MKTRFDKIQLLRVIVQVFCFVGMTTNIIAGFGEIWSGLLTLTLLASLLFGNFFCGWLCPFGTLQEWLSRAGAKLFGGRYRVPQRAERYLRFSRYIIYAVIIANESFKFAAGFSAASPFNGNSNFLSLTDTWASGGLPAMSAAANALTLIYLGSYILASLFVDRPFCRYFCPDGIPYSLASLARIYSIKRDANICIGCKKCDIVCPMNIDVANVRKMRNAGCINCMMCVSACPVRGALKYSR